MSSAKDTHNGEVVNKYLLFKIADEFYGIEILKVREILSSPRIVRMPLAPGYFRGVMDIRGSMIPVIDLRARMGLPPAESFEGSCTIVVDCLRCALPQEEEKMLLQLREETQGKQQRELQVGLTVDGVSEVAQIANKEVETLSPPTAEHWTNHLLGLAKKSEQIITLLNIDEVLS